MTRLRLIKVWDPSILLAPPALPAAFDPSDIAHLSQLQPNDQKSLPTATIFLPTQSSTSEQEMDAAVAHQQDFDPDASAASQDQCRLYFATNKSSIRQLPLIFLDGESV
jgi:hypothetical protein